ncbi:MAG: hypothetical protein LLG04_17245 [Parachlamydia sp.]|nr:hypothetical protein [Parachlamydia sp.]
MENSKVLTITKEYYDDDDGFDPHTYFALSDGSVWVVPAYDGIYPRKGRVVEVNLLDPSSPEYQNGLRYSLTFFKEDGSVEGVLFREAQGSKY